MFLIIYDPHFTKNAKDFVILPKQRYTVNFTNLLY